MLLCVLPSLGIVVVVLFFFQAEDGIRDHCVTGVQTVLFRSAPFLFKSYAKDLSPKILDFDHCSTSSAVPRIGALRRRSASALYLFA